MRYSRRLTSTSISSREGHHSSVKSESNSAESQLHDYTEPDPSMFSFRQNIYQENSIQHISSSTEEMDISAPYLDPVSIKKRDTRHFLSGAEKDDYFEEVDLPAPYLDPKSIKERDSRHVLPGSDQHNYPEEEDLPEKERYTCIKERDKGRILSGPRQDNCHEEIGIPAAYLDSVSLTRYRIAQDVSPSNSCLLSSPKEEDDHEEIPLSLIYAKVRHEDKTIEDKPPRSHSPSSSDGEVNLFEDRSPPHTYAEISCGGKTVQDKPPRSPSPSSSVEEDNPGGENSPLHINAEIKYRVKSDQDHPPKSSYPSSSVEESNFCEDIFSTHTYAKIRCGFKTTEDNPPKSPSSLSSVEHEDLCKEMVGSHSYEGEQQSSPHLSSAGENVNDYGIFNQPLPCTQFAPNEKTACNEWPSLPQPLTITENDHQSDKVAQAIVSEENAPDQGRGFLPKEETHSRPNLLSNEKDNHFKEVDLPQRCMYTNIESGHRSTQEDQAIPPMLSSTSDEEDSDFEDVQELSHVFR